MIPQLLLGLTVAYAIWSLICMEINVRRARTIGIPLVRMPVDPMNVLWLVLEPPLFRLLDRLPFSYGTFGRYSRRGWHFHDKAWSHAEYGPAWAIATPREIFMYIGDPDAINEIFARRADFLRPTQLYKMLDVYGPSVSTAGASDWPRQRKIVAAPFNENTNKLVWSESLSQAKDMLLSWASCGESGSYGAAKDTRTLSLDVLAMTGFRKSYKFRSSTEPALDETLDYRDSLKTVLDNAILLMVAPAKVLSFPMMPRSWARIGDATTNFRQYMMDMLEEETSRLSQGIPGTGSLMTSFVRALEDRNGKELHIKSDAAGPIQKGLTIDEILGNIFVINFAGHDTTANTLSFGMLLLAIHPAVQEWVAEELQEILKDTSAETWDYDILYPQLKRCQAVLLETLRLFPPILALPKWTNRYPQTLKVGDRMLSIPARTAVLPSLLAMQTLPPYWQDPLVWQPSRWIKSSTTSTDGSSTTDLTAQVEHEEVVVPQKGTYFPWSDGPQSCPGKKFAQVEFVAVIACLLRDHRVRVVPQEGEDFEKTKERISAVLEDCDLGLLLRMRDADSVKLAWERV
ncbi:MAG: hypothetical protein M1837_004900 [Sclerophora amabilis]|nr:MAG: hypothetical protein M1837_004900 [Sclerophora amabilis]